MSNFQYNNLRAFLHAWLGRRRLVPTYNDEVYILPSGQQRYRSEISVPEVPFTGLADTHLNAKAAKTMAADDFCNKLIRNRLMDPEEPRTLQLISQSQRLDFDQFKVPQPPPPHCKKVTLLPTPPQSMERTPQNRFRPTERSFTDRPNRNERDSSADRRILPSDRFRADGYGKTDHRKRFRDSDEDERNPPVITSVFSATRSTSKKNYVDLDAEDNIDVEKELKRERERERDAAKFGCSSRSGGYNSEKMLPPPPKKVAMSTSETPLDGRVGYFKSPMVPRSISATPQPSAKRFESVPKFFTPNIRSNALETEKGFNIQRSIVQMFQNLDPNVTTAATPVIGQGSIFNTPIRVQMAATPIIQRSVFNTPRTVTQAASRPSSVQPPPLPPYVFVCPEIPADKTGDIHVDYAGLKRTAGFSESEISKKVVRDLSSIEERQIIPCDGPVASEADRILRQTYDEITSMGGGVFVKSNDGSLVRMTNHADPNAADESQRPIFTEPNSHEIKKEWEEDMRLMAMTPFTRRDIALGKIEQPSPASIEPNNQRYHFKKRMIERSTKEQIGSTGDSASAAGIENSVSRANLNAECFIVPIIPMVPKREPICFDDGASLDSSGGKEKDHCGNATATAAGTSGNVAVDALPMTSGTPDSVKFDVHYRMMQELHAENFRLRMMTMGGQNSEQGDDGNVGQGERSGADGGSAGGETTGFSVTYIKDEPEWQE